MAFDEKLAERIRRRLGKRRGLTEKHMFGGLAFLLTETYVAGSMAGSSLFESIQRTRIKP